MSRIPPPLKITASTSSQESQMAPGDCTKSSKQHKRKKTLVAPQGLYEEILQTPQNFKSPSFMVVDADASDDDAQEDGRELRFLINRRMSNLVEVGRELDSSHDDGESSEVPEGKELGPSAQDFPLVTYPGVGEDGLEHGLRIPAREEHAANR